MPLKLFIMDVGHGQALQLFTPTGETVVADLGATDGFSPLACLAGSTKTIDLLVISHPHGDHIDDILNLSANGFTVRQMNRPKWLSREEVLAANAKSDRAKVDAYLDLSGRFTDPIPEERRVGNPAVSGGASIDVFYSSDCGRSDINNHSAVLVVSYLGVTLILPGDNGPASWKSLFTQPRFVTAVQGTSLFLVSHHGRESGYSADIFGKGKITPALCVVSDGPVQDTDVTSDYSGHASGWSVSSRSQPGTTSKRNCLTTRSDGYITVEIGQSASTQKTYLAVEAK